MFTHVQEKIDNQDIVEVYRGKFFDTKRSYRAARVVTLDFDETLGSFVDLEILWKTICLYTNDNPSIKIDDLLDIYPEFLRYGIISILEYLSVKKQSGECYKIFIYTNNQSNTSWVRTISNYFNNKLDRNNKLFDQIIYAFKINNRRVELNRTSHRKSHLDFINCTLLPKKTAICFLDDVEHKDMKKERIYYIKPMAYRHALCTNEIITRFIYSRLYSNIIKDPCHRELIMEDFIDRCKSANMYRSYSDIDLNTNRFDVQISRKIMFHLKEFFLLNHTPRQYTKKRKPIRSKFTRKVNLSNVS